MGGRSTFPGGRILEDSVKGVIDADGWGEFEGVGLT